MPDNDASLLFCPLEFRYGRSEVRDLFSREARLRRALKVEAALAHAQAELGIIPKADAEAIEAAATSGRVGVAKVEALERELRHDVMAISRSLAEASGASGRWVHFGATSADITDTALAMELDEAIGILRRDLTDVVRAFMGLARRHRTTIEVGRTHGQYAVPLTFGYKMAVAAAEFARHRRRLDELRPRVAVGKMAGAVGTGSGFASHAHEIEETTMRRLGLAADEAPIQIVMRDRLAEFLAWEALVAASAERVATEVRNLQRSELGEVAEPFDEEHQVGSSTMAQKRNPVVSENIASLARLVRSFAPVGWENMVQWHERDLTNSANERIAVPHSIVLLDDLLGKLTEIVRNLEVRPDRMRENLARTGGIEMTESLMLALTAHGMPRAEAHELLRRLTRQPERPPPLAERVRRDRTLRDRLPEAELEAVLASTRYVEAAAAKADRVLERLEAEFSR
ncbi:MAG: adenylosuccinate lyase [Thermoplasmata archaeon]